MTDSSAFSAAAAPSSRAQAAPLGHLAVLQAQGADAVEFLHGQLTQDVKSLDASHARLAGYCTAKGRLLATAVVWRQPAEEPAIRALVDAGVAPAWQKRLSMFVLRAKVRIAPLPLQAFGVSAGPAALAALATGAGAELPRAAWARAELPSGTWIGAPAAGAALRWWWLAEAGREGALAGAADPAPAEAWRAADIAAGLPWITAATQDLFIPQTLNLDLAGGVSFTKGCYPGQEVVARSHYLGKLKRRSFAGLVRAGVADPSALPPADIFHDGDAQPCGRVVNAADTASGTALLFECTLAAAHAGGLRLGAPDGLAIELQALPYALGEDAA
ncbi:folate-binding protein YgfZ [Pigmentiphaga soli]|uniref:Folate-binding protein YgfZ n=1 Tax=Pigmentiphaga soli TaxID=1007095 RepID=A0ABP8H7Y5_9BURK